MPTSNYNRKVRAVFLLFLSFLIFCIARLIYIQIFRSDYLAQIAKKQHSLFVELEPRRGTIYDCNLKPQAINVAAYSLYASPADISDKEKTNIISKLSGMLGLDNSYLNNRLSRNKSFIWLARKLDYQTAEKVKNLNIKDVGFIKESKRSYPNGYLASHVIGFAGIDNKGLEGLELRYNQYLQGENGWSLMLRDARQERLDLYEKMIPPKDGYDLVLTIDEVIQFIAERELDNYFKKARGQGATVIVMDPYSGAVLALANRPTYDLNNYLHVTKDQIRNRAICDLFEPGSVFKIVTASAALEEGKFSEQDRIFCENGSYKVANHILHDHTSHGWLTFREVIEQSSNIGTTKIAQSLGPDVIYRYSRAFGFGKKTDIGLIGEINGMIKEPRFWSKTSIGAVPIGQEVGVTAIQLACAISVIANGGELYKPYIVKAIKDKYDEEIKTFEPVLVRRVISESTASRVQKILTGVVEDGTGKLARVNGFSVAGKTGTAQKVEPNGAYSHSKYVASFIGFAPADEPLISIVVIIDEPRPYYFGGVAAAPIFKNIAQDTIRYLKGRNYIQNAKAAN